MAFRSVNRYDNSLEALRAEGNMIDFVHPDYKYYKQDWDMLRDFVSGERRVKQMGPLYLPPLGNDAGSTYEEYKARAVYVNMVARTINGFVGTVFRRKIKLIGLSQSEVELFDSITLEGHSLNLFGKTLLAEIATVGRVGVLVDRDATGRGAPYLTHYMAENILSWDTTKIDGKSQLSYVLLREAVANLRVNNGGSFVTATTGSTNNSMSVRYRVLRLDENGHYVQELYSTLDSGQSYNTRQTLSDVPFETIRPTRNGAPLTYIPMVIIGPDSPSPDVQRSPMIDIVTVNAAHYRTSAQLEHGRFFTALPVYYVQSSRTGTEQSEYVVGPSVVWEVGAGEKPGILEFFGTGLASLRESLVEKEEAISQLGGRIMGIRAAATSEAEHIFILKQANEMAVLLNITESLADGLTTACRWYFDWESKPRNVKVKVNQDFKSLMVGAREMRAVALLYQEGILPVEEVFRVFQDAELIEDEITLVEFQAMLEDPSQFPNQSNVEAKREGYASAASRDQERRQDAKLTAEADDVAKQKKDVDKVNNELDL